MAIHALAVSDALNGLQFVYNQFYLSSAIGAGLDRGAGWIGAIRLPATYSVCTVTLTGVIGTVINAGVVQDTSGYLWSLPSPFTISTSSINVTVTCQTAGAVSASPNTLTTIATPTGGWTSVTNSAAASPGTPAEADSAFRARLTQSTANPSQTRGEATYGGVAAVDGVTSVNYLENFTGSIDSYGNPAHSFTVVVAGGDNTTIATAIYNNKGIGPNPQGTNPASGATLVTVSITDPNNGGLTQNINFFRPGSVALLATVIIEPLTGYTSATGSAIQTAVFNYVNELQIGQVLVYSEAFGAVVNTSATAPTLTPQFSLKYLYIGNSSGGVANTSIAAGGTGYVVGDGITIATAGHNAVLTVRTIGAGGVVTGLNNSSNQPGTGYVVGSAFATTGGTGTGCTVNILTIGPTAAYVADINLAFYQQAVMNSATADVNVVVLIP